MTPRVVIVKKDDLPALRGNYTSGEVKIIQEMLEECLGLLGGIKKFASRGSTILIKPNCVFSSNL